MSTAATNKDVIYIDVDDEITGVIDKLRGSEHRIVALVLPKRATVFQSIVNMKLLKRTADTAKKHVVLITSEVGLLPLAGTVGVHVAKNLQSKPEIPTVPDDPNHDAEEEALDMNDEPTPMSTKKEPALDKSKPVGDLASKAEPADVPEDSIELDNTEDFAAGAAATGKKAKGKKDKKLKVPNFNKFRTLLIFGGTGLVALIIVLVVCLSVLPKATILVKTDSVAVPANLDLTLNPTATALKADAGVVPAVAQASQKTVSQQAPATGQRNDGTKATGSIKIINCTDSPINLSAGIGFSANGKTFVSQEAASAPASNFTSPGSGSKCKNDGFASVAVAAQNAGADYNLSAQAYSIATISNSNVSASGSDMAGGADKITKIVAQSDIDNAQQKISGQDTTAVKQELQSGLKSKGLFAIPSTLNLGNPEITASAKAGDAADNVTVTEKITYTMLGAKQSDLEKVIANSVNKDIDTKKQKILDYGLDKAVFNPQNTAAGGSSLVALQATAVAGSSLNIDTLKTQVAGKKANDAKEIIKANPGITDVDVKYSPFWVSSIPKKTGKITIEIEKPQARTNVKP
jgi:hypothetical protein